MEFLEKKSDNTIYENILYEISEIENYTIPLKQKYIFLKGILDRVCKECTSSENLQFSSLFSRIVFISQKYNLPKSLEWNLQNIRVKSIFLLKDESNTVSQSDFISAKQSLLNFLSVVYLGDILLSDNESSNIEDCEITDLSKIRVQVISIDSNNYIIYCISDVYNQEILVKYNLEKLNLEFNSTVERIWIGAQLNLIDCTYNDKSEYIVPKYIVLEPDYLIDASSLAECFQNFGRSNLHYFRRKFESNSNSHYILLGNLANFFLDELVYSDNVDNVSFNDVFLAAFRQSPFEFTSCEDIKSTHDFKDFMQRARVQFENIRRVIKNDFPINGFSTDDCILEPSFFCERFGFQGRLDLLQFTSADHRMRIVELKSGGLPFPKDNPGKVSVNHEVQTIIYRLMIQSVFHKKSRDIFSSILYSVAENSGENLRASVSYQTLEKEIINIRNLIIADEHDLYTGGYEDVENVFDKLCDLDSYKRPPLFFSGRILEIEKILDRLTSLEKKYFFRFVSFITRELYIQKLGNEGYESNSGLSSLWTIPFEERLNSYDLIPNLEIEKIEDFQSSMTILFRKTISTDFENFREGEICVLYPKDNEDDTILSNQIIKGTIAFIDSTNVLVRFRYKQKNKQYLHRHKHWVIEHDKLDHGYNAMYKSLYSFISSPIETRSKLLGLKKPVSTLDNICDNNLVINDISSESIKDRILEKAINAEDYFLIVGPPGTGKTSIFARRLVEIFYDNPQNNILLIAYTNRAVDELCEAVNLSFGDEYIRIGTELSCHENYKNRLLQNVAKTVKNRDELRTIMFNTRIYIGTLASIVGKPELFNLKKFNISIIDEASQILEPQIIGLLPKFDKFIMIGDHKQLSTITLQDSLHSKVDDGDLNDMELVSCGESYFERLYRICKKNNWINAFDTLIYQGRMHEDIAAFPNKYFYNEMLQSANMWQKKKLQIFKSESPQTIFDKMVSEERFAFLSIEKVDYNYPDKVNIEEANAAVELAKSVIEHYKLTRSDFDERKSLGIITPYRNQIALIKYCLKQSNYPELENIMVDTVERYQGSQRDIIIISLCLNKPYQLEFFSNMDRTNTVDRKLNVALTRARQQLFILGNENILLHKELYKTLLQATNIYRL